jgi:(S)-3,5-dihydroxyphenylglycine transaminase
MKLGIAELHSSVSDPLLDTMNFLNEITFRYPDAISFAPGRPYDGFFDCTDVFTDLRRYLDHLAGQGHSESYIRTVIYQYGPTAGQIRELIAASLQADENIVVDPEAVVVTVGAQEAMVLALRTLFRGPDDVLLVVCPCYVGIVGAARLLGIPVVDVPERDGCLRVRDVEAAIQAERARGRLPRAIYVVPDHSNPSGATMDLAARRELLDLASRHGILVLEDNPYRLVSPGSRMPTLKSLDHDQAVIYLGSFSKTVFPGARVGFAVADQPVTGPVGETSLLAAELAKVKSMITVNTSSLSQAVIAGALLSCDGRLADANAAAAARYGTSMRATLHELDRRIPEERRAGIRVSWNRPTGGFFLSLQVPFDADNATLERSAEDFGVIWTPMRYFYPRSGGERALRLSVSYLTPDEITEGIDRLARFIESELAAT